MELPIGNLTNEEHKRIEVNHKQITEEVRMGKVSGDLILDGVITLREWEHILQTYKQERERTETFLTTLHTKRRGSYLCFVNALRTAGYNNVANLLDTRIKSERQDSGVGSDSADNRNRNSKPTESSLDVHPYPDVKPADHTPSVVTGNKELKDLKAALDKFQHEVIWKVDSILKKDSTDTKIETALRRMREDSDRILDLKLTKMSNEIREELRQNYTKSLEEAMNKVSTEHAKQLEELQAAKDKETFELWRKISTLEAEIKAYKEKVIQQNHDYQRLGQHIEDKEIVMDQLKDTIKAKERELQRLRQQLEDLRIRNAYARPALPFRPPTPFQRGDTTYPFTANRTFDTPYAYFETARDLKRLPTQSLPSMSPGEPAVSKTVEPGRQIRPPGHLGSLPLAIQTDQIDVGKLNISSKKDASTRCPGKRPASFRDKRRLSGSFEKHNATKK